MIQEGEMPRHAQCELYGVTAWHNYKPCNAPSIDRERDRGIIINHPCLLQPTGGSITAPCEIFLGLLLTSKFFAWINFVWIIEIY